MRCEQSAYEASSPAPAQSKDFLESGHLWNAAITALGGGAGLPVQSRRRDSPALHEKINPYSSSPLAMKGYRGRDIRCCR